MQTPELHSILLIDDNPNDRLLARRQLNKFFHQASIQEACNQAQLDRALAENSYELVITDYQLGWSTGIEVLKTVKQLRPNCPIVMFTNTGTQEIAVAAMKLGLDDYIIKTPRHFDRLTQAVSAVWQRSQAELRADELDSRLQALLNQLKVGIFRATPDGQLLDANPALLKMIGASSIAAAQQVWTKQLSEHVAIANPREPVKLTQEIEIEIEQATAQSKAIQDEAIAQRSGDTRWIRISATLNVAIQKPIVDGLVEDITARKRAQQSLQSINALLERKVEFRTQQLEKSNQELESFAYSVSHDLRTPIRQVTAFIDLLKAHLNVPLEEETPRTTAIGHSTNSLAKIETTDSRSPDQKTRHYLNTLSNLAARSDAMIRSLLNLSRLGKTAMVTVPVKMTDLVKQEIAQFNRPSERAASEPPDRAAWEEHVSKGYKHLVCFMVQPMPIVNCDRTLIRTVWQNLIDNALKFTQNQPHPKIIIGAKDANPAALETIFFIQDNGAGFSSEQAEKIFGIFQQAHSKQDFEGSGIGLATVRRIISRHKGRVWAESEVGKGATFYFSLPKTIKCEDKPGKVKNIRQSYLH